MAQVKVSLISLQVRAVNEFNLAGNWSEAVVIDIPKPTFIVIIITALRNTYIVVPPVGLAVLILVLVVVAVFVSHRCCFHHNNFQNSEPFQHVKNGPS